MDIAASTVAATAPKPAFESLDGAVRRLSAAEAKPPLEPASEPVPPRYSRKGQTLDIRV